MSARFRKGCVHPAAAAPGQDGLLGRRHDQDRHQGSIRRRSSRARIRRSPRPGVTLRPGRQPDGHRGNAAGTVRRARRGRRRRPGEARRRHSVLHPEGLSHGGEPAQKPAAGARLSRTSMRCKAIRYFFDCTPIATVGGLQQPSSLLKLKQPVLIGTIPGQGLHPRRDVACEGADRSPAHPRSRHQGEPDQSLAAGRSTRHRQERCCRPRLRYIGDVDTPIYATLGGTARSDLPTGSSRPAVLLPEARRLRCRKRNRKSRSWVRT